MINKKQLTYLLILECKRSTLCDDRKSSCDHLEDEGGEMHTQMCQTKSWHSIISVADNISGVRSIHVTSPGSSSISKTENVNLQYPEYIGTVEDVNVWLETSCCYDGVEITVNDVVGHKTKCVAGINPNPANIISVYFIHYYILLCYLILLYS